MATEHGNARSVRRQAGDFDHAAGKAGVNRTSRLHETAGSSQSIVFSRYALAQRDVPESFEAAVQIRYSHRGCAARIRRTGQDTFAVEFAEPVHAVTPGQAAVVYEGDVLLGGGWID